MLRYGDMSKDEYTYVRYKISKEMLSGLQPTDRVLDIGCYDGYFLSTLNADTYGFDVDAEALKIAEGRGIKVLNSLQIPVLFDTIICTEVLEHLKNPGEMMMLIKNILLPNGTFLVSLPNECNLWTRIRMLLGWGVNDLPFDPEYHLHFPTLKQGENFIKKYFKIRRKKYWVYGPQWLKIIPNLFARGAIYECY